MDQSTDCKFEYCRLAAAGWGGENKVVVGSKHSIKTLGLNGVEIRKMKDKSKTIRKLTD